MKICAACEEALMDALRALHEHDRDMTTVVALNLIGEMTEEDRRYLAPQIAESFNKAQTLWDAYRDHLIGHGFLSPTSRKIRMASGGS